MPPRFRQLGRQVRHFRSQQDGACIGGFFVEQVQQRYPSPRLRLADAFQPVGDLVGEQCRSAVEQVDGGEAVRQILDHQIAFFADRSIEYSGSYAAFQIGVSRVLFPIGQALGQGDLFGWVWTAFQWVSTVVGFFSALAKIWPAIRRMLGPEPVTEG